MVVMLLCWLRVYHNECCAVQFPISNLLDMCDTPSQFPISNVFHMCYTHSCTPRHSLCRHPSRTACRQGICKTTKMRCYCVKRLTRLVSAIWAPQWSQSQRTALPYSLTKHWRVWNAEKKKKEKNLEDSLEFSLAYSCRFLHLWETKNGYSQWSIDCS